MTRFKVSRRGRLAAAAFVLAALALWLTLIPPRPVEAGWLLFQLATARVPALIPANATWSMAGRSYRGDLYGDSMRSRSALLLVPGAAETGKDDPRLVAFARGLAGHGFLVLVPDLPGPKALRVSSEDIVGIADSASYLSGLTHGKGPLGIAAISYGVGPAILAAMQPRLRGRVSFLIGLGGYYDTTTVITFFTTGFWHKKPDEPWWPGKPNAYGKWVFVLANAARLDDFADRERLSNIARAKLRNLNADIRPIETSLEPEGRAVMALLDNKDPARVPALIAVLPEGIRHEIEALDLADKDLGSLRAQIMLIHGRDDAIVPYSESLALANALAQALGPARIHLYLLDHLAHATLGPGGFKDMWRLWQATDRLLAIRDGIS